MIWFIGDTHFGHERIIELAGRPFKSVKEMDDCMVRRWNQKVTAGDVVMHLGDFAMTDRRRGKEVLALLAGKKVLVRGNHDRGVTAMLEWGFDAVVEECLVVVPVKHGAARLLCTHKPLIVGEAELRSRGCDGVVHGHIHQGRPDDLAEAGESVDVPWFNVNVCVEKTGYMPLTGEEVMARLRMQRS